MNRRGFLQSVLTAAVAAYAGLPEVQPLTPVLLEHLPAEFKAYVWIEDADGRKLTEAGALRMRRVTWGEWEQQGEFQVTAIETGVAATMCCGINGRLIRIPVGPDGLQMDTRNLVTASVISVTAATFVRDTS